MPATTPHPHTLVIEPDAECSLDRLAAPLVTAGLDIETVRPWRGDEIPTTLDADALVILGGDMGANDLAQHPWLREVRALASAAVAARVPTLGICLGGQILAAACGGEIRRGVNGVEVGAVDVNWTEEARADALVATLPAPFVTGSWHRDEIHRLPAGAVLLGSSSQYPHQAFRLGPAAWGLQFHPEVSLTGFRTWAAHPESGADETVSRGAARFERDHATVGAHGRELGAAFARVVLAAAGQR